MTQGTGASTRSLTRPDWERTWQAYGNEAWLTAKALIEISPALLADARQYTGWSRGDGHRDADGVFHPAPQFQAAAWLASVDQDGRGWSSTERRLFDLVASLLDDDRPLRLVGTLDSMGSWESQVWAVLVQWGTGGDNRDYPGRLHLD